MERLITLSRCFSFGESTDVKLTLFCLEFYPNSIETLYLLTLLFASRLSIRMEDKRWQLLELAVFIDCLSSQLSEEFFGKEILIQYIRRYKLKSNYAE